MKRIKSTINFIILSFSILSKIEQIGILFLFFAALISINLSIPLFILSFFILLGTCITAVTHTLNPFKHTIFYNGNLYGTIHIHKGCLQMHENIHASNKNPKIKENGFEWELIVNAFDETIWLMNYHFFDTEKSYIEINFTHIDTIRKISTQDKESALKFIDTFCSSAKIKSIIPININENNNR